MKNKKLIQQDKVLLVIILSAALIFACFIPFIEGVARNSYHDDETVRLNNIDSYTDSYSLSEKSIYAMQRLYLDYQMQQGTIKKLDAESVSSALLENANDMSKEDKEGFFQAFMESSNNDIYDRAYYYITDGEHEAYTNEKSLKTMFEKNNDSYMEEKNDSSWYFSMRTDEKGKLKVLSTNVKSGLDDDFYDNAFVMLSQWYMVEGSVEPAPKALKNISFAIEIPLHMLVSQDVVMDDGAYYPIDGYYRPALLCGYGIFMVLLFAAGLLLPDKKLRESIWIERFSSHLGMVMMVIAQLVFLVTVAGLASAICNHITINSPIFSIFMIPVLAGLLFPSLMLGIGMRRLFLNENAKEESQLYTAALHVGHKIENFFTNILRIDFNDNNRKRAIMIVAVNAFCIIFLTIIYLLENSQDMGGLIIIVIIYSAIVYYLLNRSFKNMKKDYDRLDSMIQKTAHGNFEHQNEDLGIFEPMKESLQNLQNDFQEAVEQEVQSQRMKTELITNVSHDLKTPLTSIISYIDLLKDENLSDEERRKYVSILETSSGRLKHLIENLFEISKANSGNVTMDYMDVDIISLLKQAEMECENVLSKKQLVLRNQFQEEKVILKLDSQKTYRIFENLLSNVGKYALENTRVYVRVEDYGTMVEISIKNVSAEELDFDPDEIMERFTRGDKSRNTEGSGLGLAIARSFSELQNGTMKIVIDGDLFKAVIRFHRSDEQE